MCYDQKSSFTAWVIGFVSGLLLFLRNKPNDRWIGLFVMVFTGIQFIEYKLWKSIDEKDKVSNEKWTKVTLINLWTQALTLSVGAMVYGKVTPQNKTLYLVLVVSVALMIIFMIQSIKSVLDPTQTFQTVPGPSGHLVWTRKTPENTDAMNNGFLNLDHRWLAATVYMIGLFLPYLFMSQRNRALCALIVVGSTSLYNYFNYYSTGEFSSMWCYYSVGYSLLSWLPFN